MGEPTSHDGYVGRFGVFHERELALAAGGDILEGTDRVYRQGGTPPPEGKVKVDVRFHIHPDVGLFRDRQERLVLAARDGESWTFECSDLEAEIEESIFFAGLGGPKRSCQIVLSFDAARMPEVHWRMVRGRTTG
jgi:uncharacterized heparinase superfamily protein